MNERTNGQANNIKEKEKKMTRRRTVDMELSQYHQVRAVVSPFLPSFRHKLDTNELVG